MFLEQDLLLHAGSQDVVCFWRIAPAEQSRAAATATLAHSYIVLLLLTTEELCA